MRAIFQGSFLERNSYALRDHVPWYVAFVVGGDLAGRSDPFFDSSMEISLELLTEWLRFHASRGASPVLALHFPLEGEHLLRAMSRLGLGTNTLAGGTAAYLSVLKRHLPSYRECYMPVAFLAAIEEETREPPPFPEEGRQRVAHGAWLAPQPQSRWSRRHTAIDGTEGYLWYAPVYAAEDGDWDKSVDILGYYRPTARAPRPFQGLSAWLASLRSQGIRIVPVLAATDNDAARDLALRSQEEEKPQGLLYQNFQEEGGRLATVPEGWWELSRASARSQLRLEK